MKNYIKFARGNEIDPEDPRVTAIKKAGMLNTSLKPLSSIISSNGNTVPYYNDGKAKKVGRTVSPLPVLQTRNSPNIELPLLRKPKRKFNIPLTERQIENGAENAAPFVSNIINSFRSAPNPIYPILDSSPTLQKINLSGERYEISRGTNAANKATERNVDARTAEVIKQYNRADEFNKLSNVNERENNTNVSINNAQAGMDMQIRGMNTERINDYYTSQTAARIANQREQSSNVANAGDKIVAINNEKRKAKVDNQKTRVLSSLFSKSGVMNRNRIQLKASGIDDPLGIDYSDVDKKQKNAYGGMMKKIPTKKLY